MASSLIQSHLLIPTSRPPKHYILQINQADSPLQESIKVPLGSSTTEDQAEVPKGASMIRDEMEVPNVPLDTGLFEDMREAPGRLWDGQG